MPCSLRALLLGALVVAVQPAAAQQAVGNAMTIARLQYSGGGDWYVGPSTLPNLLQEIRKRTGLATAERPINVKLTDPALWNYPFLFMSGHGNIRFSDEELSVLRRYLLSGGFLYADDCYGLDPSFRREIKRVFPDKELVELPSSHAVFHAFYDLPGGMPKVHKHDGKAPQLFAIIDQGRVVTLYAYESDIHDGWEDEQVHDDPPQNRELAFKMGVNIFVFALSQSVVR